MNEYLNWLSYSLGLTFGYSLAALIGYVVGGTTGVYVMSSLMLTGCFSTQTRAAGGDLEPGTAIMLGLGISFVLMIPGLLIRYAIARKPMRFWHSAAVTGALTIPLVHALASVPNGTDYAGVLAALTFATCRSGFSHPLRRQPEEDADDVIEGPKKGASPET